MQSNYKEDHWNTLKKACCHENQILMPLEGNFVQIVRKLGTWFHP